MQLIIPAMGSGRIPLVWTWGLNDWIRAFWEPIDGPLWYIRDLFISMLLSPLVYIVVRKTGAFSILCVVILYIVGATEIEAIKPVKLWSIYFFTIGAYLGINNVNLSEKANRYKFINIIPIIYLVLSLINLKMWDKHLFAFNIIIGMVSVYIVVNKIIIKRGEFINRSLIDSNFFIYAYHVMFCNFLIKVLLKVHFLNYIEIYLIVPFIALAIGYTLFMMCKRVSPQFLSLLTGGRY